MLIGKDWAWGTGTESGGTGGAGSSGAQIGSRSAAFGKGWAWDTGSGLAGTINRAQGRGGHRSAVDFGGTGAMGDRGGLGRTGSGSGTSGAGDVKVAFVSLCFHSKSLTQVT